MEIKWTKGGELLMNRRDRYAQRAIRESFTPNKSAAVKVDREGVWFVTPVADYQYSVVWREDPNEPEHVLVEAVVPAYFNEKHAGNLVTQVKQVVEKESGGAVHLEQLAADV